VRISGLPFESHRTKCYLDVSLMKRHKTYYKGRRWWLPPSPGCGESCESELPLVRPSTKNVPTMH
jgi:hypothetical protein